MSTDPVVRRAARVLLIDPADRILLFLANGQFTDGEWLWLTPGGGLEEGETFEQAAERELWEETGLRAAPGSCVWTRTHTYPFRGGWEQAVERFYVVRCAAFTPDGTNWEPNEAPELASFRWWSLAEIAGSSEIFAPRRLADLLPAVLLDDLPAEPFDCGV